VAAHIHENCEAGIYVESGQIRVWTGPDVANLTPQDVPAGHFLYIPRGELHSVENPSPTEPAVTVFAYGGVPNREAAGTIEPQAAVEQA
jgi:uncharacterized RmlC-like cupin family protein